MRIVSLKILKQFCLRHPDAVSGVRQWTQRIDTGTPRNFNEMRALFGSVDYVPPFTIFNIAGNKYRLIATVQYTGQSVFVRWLLTHAEYDKWTKLYHQGRVKP
jgi:mRNA interferase HigB